MFKVRNVFHTSSTLASLSLTDLLRPCCTRLRCGIVADWHKNPLDWCLKAQSLASKAVFNAAETWGSMDRGNARGRADDDDDKKPQEEKKIDWVTFKDAADGMAVTLRPEGAPKGATTRFNAVILHKGGDKVTVRWHAPQDGGPPEDWGLRKSDVRRDWWDSRAKAQRLQKNDVRKANERDDTADQDRKPFQGVDRLLLGPKARPRPASYARAGATQKPPIASGVESRVTPQPRAPQQASPKGQRRQIKFVFAGIDTRTGAPVAVKMSGAEDETLAAEAQVYQKLRDQPGFPKYHWHGSTPDGGSTALVVDLLGNSLGGLVAGRGALGRRAALLVGWKLLDSVEKLHRMRLSRRDDLESIGYDLPWMGLGGDTEKEMFRRVSSRKAHAVAHSRELCAGCAELRQYSE
eukprot:gene7748-28031_t